LDTFRPHDGMDTEATRAGGGNDNNITGIGDEEGEGIELSNLSGTVCESNGGRGGDSGVQLDTIAGTLLLSQEGGTISLGELEGESSSRLIPAHRTWAP